MRIPITAETLEDARDYLEDAQIDDQHIERWNGRASRDDTFIGALGEFEVLKYLWSNGIEATKSKIFTHDINLGSGHRLEVKTRFSKARPEPHYMANFTERSIREDFDYIFFVIVQVGGSHQDPTFDSIHLMGACSRLKLLRLATLRQAGDPILRRDAKGNDIHTGARWMDDCYQIPVTDLSPPPATINYFRILQTKENQ